MTRTLRTLVGFVLVALVAVLALGVASPSYAATYPTLSTGSTGANVASLQYLLTSRGYATAADGDYGSGTRAAVTAFQSAAGLTADGVAGPATFGAVVSTLRQGDTGPAVQALQVQLVKHGASISTDGDFGPAADDAVRSFQSSHGLAVDGVVGPATWQELLGTGGGGATPGTTYDSLSEEQKANARTIIGVAKGAGVPQYGWVIALATAMQESTLINLDYGDRDSLGLFQQRTSQGWGTEAQIMDPVLSSKAFYGVAAHTSNPGLLDISGWESMSVTQAAQAVQRSCCPDAYAKWETLARDIVAHESGAPTIPRADTPGRSRRTGR
ncbi:peptidoglycan-binding protein [Nocardioides sp. YIM 152315]|uniref:peptidoglycan-binding domain-containing protein n=1 Tax=Nocardioides sp. YIM 152315 TaxID=3031760 RepID=UPI0023D9ECB2|nr:peptidoglycan-binding protein [Nocardioides sp. YIM 152315]MDF1602145.1 peptidoglycan-binding protein [Nocardioides sp. YIM 152315]